MGNLADIPEHLLSPVERTNFVVWLSGLPIDLQARRGLATIWAEATELPLLKEHWDTIEQSSPNNSNVS